MLPSPGLAARHASRSPTSQRSGAAYTARNTAESCSSSGTNGPSPRIDKWITRPSLRTSSLSARRAFPVALMQQPGLVDENQIQRFRVTATSVGRQDDQLPMRTDDAPRIRSAQKLQAPEPGHRRDGLALAQQQPACPVRLATAPFQPAVRSGPAR